MKNIKFLFLAVLTSFVIFSCNKEREEEPENSYSNADEFYEDNKEEEQEFIIETDTGDCIIAKKGTIICGDRTGLQTASNGTVELPYSIKVVELYSIKDHLLYNFPTTSKGEALKNQGTIRVKACKDGAETSIINKGAFTATYNVDPATVGNSLLKGTMSDDTFSDWEFATDGSSLTTPSTKNNLSLATFGWFQAAQNTFDSPTTIVTFSLDGTGGESLDLWLIQSSTNTLMHGTDLKIENVPTGESYTAIVIAVDQDNNLVLHESSFTVSANQQVTIEFNETKEDDLITQLEAL